MHRPTSLSPPPRGQRLVSAVQAVRPKRELGVDDVLSERCVK